MNGSAPCVVQANMVYKMWVSIERNGRGKLTHVSRNQPIHSTACAEAIGFPYPPAEIHDSRIVRHLPYQAKRRNHRAIPAARLTRWVHRNPPRVFATRNAKALHEAARVPPMDYRDNLYRANQGSILDADRGSKFKAD